MSDAYQGVSPNSRLLTGDLTSGARIQARTRNALSFSMAAHAAVFVIAIAIVARMPQVAQAPPASMSVVTTGIVFLDSPGPVIPGGGGGNKNPLPPRKAELPGHDTITVPAARPPNLENQVSPKNVPELVQVNIPAVAVASGVLEAPGAIAGLFGMSRGSGIGDGVGTGPGTGIGSGDGSGYGPGSGPYGAGGGVTSPRLLVEVKPSYTPDAMRAKIQGLVTLEAVVMPDGSVGTVRVTRSLDSIFGLDLEAAKAVKRWRFSPATMHGTPVRTLVQVEMAFALR